MALNGHAYPGRSVLPWREDRLRRAEAGAYPAIVKIWNQAICAKSPDTAPNRVPSWGDQLNTATDHCCKWGSDASVDGPCAKTLEQGSRRNARPRSSHCDCPIRGPVTGNGPKRRSRRHGHSSTKHESISVGGSTAKEFRIRDQIKCMFPGHSQGCALLPLHEIASRHGEDKPKSASARTAGADRVNVVSVDGPNATNLI